MAVLAEPLADGLTRGEALRFGALLHDAAKPQTRAETPEGRITFMGHDAAGAELARAVLSRLRTSDRLQAHVAALARHHLRLGFLVHERPLSRRQVYRYLRACEPVEVDVTVLSVADRLATRGAPPDDAITDAPRPCPGEMLGEALRWRAQGAARAARARRRAGRRAGDRAGPAAGRAARRARRGGLRGGDRHARAGAGAGALAGGGLRASAPEAATPSPSSLAPSRSSTTIMITALLSDMNRLTAPSGRAARSAATRWKSTAPATVIEPRATNTAMATAVSLESSPASAIDAAAVRVSARFFGFAPESAAPSTTALAGVALSMVAIQLGISGSSPGFGRFVHCLAAMQQEEDPDGDLEPVETRVVAVGVRSAPTSSTTMTLTQSRPAIQPAANAGPAVRAGRAPRTTTTATIGIGLSATASAEGSRSPMASFNTPRLARRRRATRPPRTASRPRRRCRSPRGRACRSASGSWSAPCTG